MEATEKVVLREWDEVELTEDELGDEISAELDDSELRLALDDPDVTLELDDSESVVVVWDVTLVPEKLLLEETKEPI